MQAGELIKQQLTPLFGANLYADFIPENCKAVQVCVYQYISSNAVNTMDTGYIKQDACRIQVDVYAKNLGDAMQKAALIIAAVTEQTTLPALFLGKRTIPEPETRKTRISLDFSIWEQTP